jgi:hypothetical protein
MAYAAVAVKWLRHMRTRRPRPGIKRSAQSIRFARAFPGGADSSRRQFLLKPSTTSPVSSRAPAMCLLHSTLGAAGDQLCEKRRHNALERLRGVTLTPVGDAHGI